MVSKQNLFIELAGKKKQNQDYQWVQSGFDLYPSTKNQRTYPYDVLLCFLSKVDDTYERGNIVMVDNGHGAEVRIPSVFIHRRHGQIIKKFAEENKDAVISMTLEFL